MWTEYVIIGLLSVIILYDWLSSRDLSKRVKNLETVVFYNIIYLTDKYEDYGESGLLDKQKPPRT